MRYADDPVAELPHEARLPHSGFTAEEQRITVSLDGLLPAVEEQAELLLAIDEGSETRPMGGVDVALRRTRV